MATKAELELELKNLKEATRTLIVDAMNDGTICTDGGNDALRTLGLEPVKTSYSGEVIVSFTVGGFELDVPEGIDPTEVMYEKLAASLNIVLANAPGIDEYNLYDGYTLYAN